jgi:hypothetical protein
MSKKNKEKFEEALNEIRRFELAFLNSYNRRVSNHTIPPFFLFKSTIKGVTSLMIEEVNYNFPFPYASFLYAKTPNRKDVKNILFLLELIKSSQFKFVDNQISFAYIYDNGQYQIPSSVQLSDFTKNFIFFDKDKAEQQVGLLKANNLRFEK